MPIPQTFVSPRQTPNSFSNKSNALNASELNINNRNSHFERLKTLKSSSDDINKV